MPDGTSTDQLRTCTGCGERKPDDQFYRRPNGTPSAECKECSKARQRNTRDAKRATLGLPPLDRRTLKCDTAGRQCTLCRKYQSWDEFYGASARCKRCVSEVLARRTAERGGIAYSTMWGNGWRVCTACGKRKLNTEFSVRKAGREGRQSKCKDCVNATRKEWRAVNIEHVRNTDREYEQRVGRHTRRRYGLDREQWEARIEAQDGRCAACGRLPRRRLVGDHCHRSGKFRGIVCDNCNVSMGLTGDDPVLLRRLAEWIEHGGACAAPAD